MVVRVGRSAEGWGWVSAGIPVSSNSASIEKLWPCAEVIAKKVASSNEGTVIVDNTLDPANRLVKHSGFRLGDLFRNRPIVRAKTAVLSRVSDGQRH